MDAPFIQQAQALGEKITGWRRELHQFPEVGLETPQTEAFICARLDEMGVPYRKNVGGHGVVALVEGTKGQGKCFAFRVDCDGLPIREEVDLPFASQNGCMHACAHDAHTAMGLGAAQLLMAHRSEFAGSVKILFQPGEETSTGANAMIADGALENPHADVILGTHSGSLAAEWLKPGQVGFFPGVFMSFLDKWEFTVTGKGGHGAYPHTTVDPIPVACRIVEALQAVISREMSPLTPRVLTVGEIHAHSAAFNIIPDSCRVVGTTRALSEELRTWMEHRIEEVARGIAAVAGASVEYSYYRGAPNLYNDPDVTSEIMGYAREIFGDEGVAFIPQATMGGEDFASYTQILPGTYVNIPTPAKSGPKPHHNPLFEIDDSELWRGSAFLAGSALRWLQARG